MITGWLIDRLINGQFEIFPVDQMRCDEETVLTRWLLPSCLFLSEIDYISTAQTMLSKSSDPPFPLLIIVFNLVLA